MSRVSIKNISIEHRLSILLLGMLFLTNRYLDGVSFATHGRGDAASSFTTILLFRT
jgi:hypothetical protein